MGKIKIGVFGAQRGGVMIKMLASHPEAELVAVCDKYRPLLDNVQKLADDRQIKVGLYETFDEFINHDMDAVVLANYANEHAPYAVRLLMSGRHVMSEVLPCETMSQAVALIEAVEASGMVYAYAENYCYMPAPFEMRRRYERGDIGEVQYAEGEYVHDCASIWPQITYGERFHWRNRIYSTYYCTHSLGPLLTITGRRPVRVVGFETNANTSRGNTDMSAMFSSGGIEMVTLDNGAVVKSIHGGLKREPASINYEVYGTRGMMESNRWDGSEMAAYIEGEKFCHGELTHYKPEPFISSGLSKAVSGHGGGDFYTTHFFIEKILGTDDGNKYSIDVYTAVDMGICGILAYRSVLNGNAPVDVPDFRDKLARGAYVDDNACTNPNVAGDQLLPISPYFDADTIPDSEFDRYRKLWLDGKNAE
ncbi:MAG: Gfo/Idh/MocA family oxidoreductase [Oscillospiraceae bacterium]|nr:Gfo/Idh/MocA family oxidoreductase [Oscillospiraceae bacterium]